MSDCVWTTANMQAIIDQIEGGQMSTYTLREYLDSALRSPLSSQISSINSAINGNINSSKNAICQTIHNELVDHLGDFEAQIDDSTKAVLEIS